MKESNSKKEKKGSWGVKEKKKKARKEKIIEVKEKKEYDFPKLIKFPEFRLFCPALMSCMN